MEQNRTLLLSWVRVKLVMAAAMMWMLGVGVVHAQQSLETQYRVTGDAVTGLFEKHRLEIQKITAVLVDGRKQVSYGTVVSEDGYILTKASEVEGIENLKVRIDTKEYSHGAVVAVDTQWDVALLKVDAKGLDVPVYAETSHLPQGSWVIVNGATSRLKRRVLVGVISANTREIKAAGGVVLGIFLEEKKGKLFIEEVAEGSGAEKAGLKHGDQLVSIDGKEITKIDELTKWMEGKQQSMDVKVVLLRGKERLEIDVELSSQKELFQEMDRNDQMSGDFSKRRSGFPRVLQHDVLATSDTMGGPVLNIEGKVIGMNIARANRAETFAIPLEEMKELSLRLLEEAKK